MTMPLQACDGSGKPFCLRGYRLCLSPRLGTGQARASGTLWRPLQYGYYFGIVQLYLLTKKVQLHCMVLLEVNIMLMFLALRPA